jgi:hypothetical protein
MQQLNIIQGDSVTIALTLPIDKMDELQDLSVYLGGSEVAKLSTNTLIPTVDENIFLVKLTSKQTSNIVGKHELVLAFDYSDIGVKKVKDLFTLNISTTGNKFSNTSTSNVISINITFTIIETALSGSSELANVAIGETGNGISNVTLFSTVGNLKTYRILYTNSTHFDFVVTDGINGVNGTNGTNGVDGNGISSITLLSTVGLVKTYRITFTDSSIFDFIVTDGAQGLQGLKGDKGDTGERGLQGVAGNNGTNGLSAYEIAVQEGYVGTQTQWNNDNKNRTFINTLILG